MNDIKDDAPIINAAGVPLPRKAWALVRDGVVVQIVQTYDHVRHPFAGVDGAPDGEIEHGRGHKVPLCGYAVLDVSNAAASPGMLIDERGNLTPLEGRTRALLPGESACHAPSAAQTVRVDAATAPDPEPKPETPVPDIPEA